MTSRLRTRASILGLGLLALCRALAARADDTGAPRIHVKAVVLPTLTFAPLYVARAEGFFAQQGLDVDLEEIGGSAPSIPLLVRGEVDVLTGWLSSGLLNVMARGAHVRLVADRGHVAPSGCTFLAILARRDLAEKTDLDSPEQLRGRRISVQTTVAPEYYFEKILKAKGLTTTDVQAITIPNAARPGALQNGALDLLYSEDPEITRLLHANAVVVWNRAEQIVPDFEWGIVAYGPTLLDQNRDAGRRFMVAYLKAVRQLAQGKTERNLDIIQQATTIDRALLRDACWPAINLNGHINVNSVRDFTAWAQSKGYLDAAVSEAQFWDPSFADYASQVLDASH